MHVSDDLRVGTELAGYRIESQLGAGGMSVVYLAEDLRLRRKVALKLLAAALAEDDSFRDRFLHESELAAAIDHPNIVPIYEAGEAQGLLYIAMRFVEGLDLGERLRLGPLDLADTIGVVAQVASALDAAHARGLVHRDVKPSNVLLDPGARPDGSDHVYLADFGITRRISEESAIGEDGSLLGTLDYVAPEQIAGEEVDAQADVYSLGCVLYECLVGQAPFRRDSDLAVVFAHLETEPPAPSAKRPELPVALDTVIARALSKEPNERYGSCRELAREALAVVVDEASRRLVDVASRAAAGRSDLSEVEAELTGKVVDLQLVQEQARALAGSSTQVPLATQGVCPFKGLASFEPVDAEYFFGRERLVAELVARLVGARFLGIVGPSGSGKSSVLRAGLLPALAGGVLPGSESWRRLLLRPGERPLEELRRVLVSGARDPLAEALQSLPPHARLLLAVDQLEELFTACTSESERAAFADTLTRAAADPEGRAMVVVAMRADFYGRLAAYPGLADLLGANQVLVASMQASELRRAVELPASRVGLQVEPELVDALVDDIEGEPGALPLLSTSLLELWQKREGETLTLATYRESGGVHGAVARLAERTYARIPDDRTHLVRAVLLRLVGGDEGDAPVRRRAPLAELDLERNEDVAEVLATLAESRLVTVGEGSVEVAHEALLREWPRLREWIQEDAEGRRLRRHVTRAAADWDAAGRDHGELYRGARLAAALDWSTDHAFELNELEREFVAVSREASEREARRARRTNRRLRALLAGVAVLLVAAVVGGVLAVTQRSEARNAETAQLAQRLGAQALVEEDLDLSLLLARQAVAVDDSPQTRGYLLAALRKSPAAIGIMHAPGYQLRGVSISPNGKTLAAIGGGIGLARYDARSFARTAKRLPQYPGESVAYRPDGRAIAVGGDRVVLLVDTTTGDQLAEATLGGAAERMAFTKDGSKLVVLVAPGPLNGLGEGDARIVVLDGTTLARVGRPIEPRSYVGAYIGFQFAAPDFALAPNERSLLTASEDGQLAQWDLRTRRWTRAWKIAVSPPPVALAVSPDGRTAVVGVQGGIQIVDLRAGRVRTATRFLAGSPSSVRFSPDARTVVSTNFDGTVTLWDVASATPRDMLTGHWNSVQGSAFSPDGKTLYTVSHDGSAIAWDLTGDRVLGRPFRFTRDPKISSTGFDGHPGQFSPDGRRIAVGLAGRGIAIWDAERLEPVGRPLDDAEGEVKSLAFSPDGQTLAADGVTLLPRAFRASTTLWDVASRSRRARTLSGGGVSFSPDGRTLATSDERGLQLWDAATGESRGTIPTAGGSPSFSADGALLATARGWNGGADVWDVATRERVAAIEPRSALEIDWTVALSPHGHVLAVGGWGPVVRLVDVRTGRLLHELDLAGTGAISLEFSPDGGLLAVSGNEPVASLWDVATGTQIGPRLTTGSRRVSVDLSPDGHSLLMTAGNGEGAVWDIDPESWKRRACRIANRTLTRKEWEKFLPGRPYDPACVA